MDSSTTWDIEDFFYGTYPEDKYKGTRIVGGINEDMNAVGKRRPEVNKENLQWIELNNVGFVDKYPWRKILSNRFERFGVYSTRDVIKNNGLPEFYVYMNFSIDHVEYRSVIHYLLTMYYRNDPSYAVNFAIPAKDQPVTGTGFWGSVGDALREHHSKLRDGIRQPDPEFEANFETYVKRAALAKFSQNPEALNILKLTEQAVLSEKHPDGRILDLHWLMDVREELKNKDQIFYFSDGKDDADAYKSELVRLKDVRKLNTFYVDDGAPGTLAMGNVPNDTLSKNGILHMNGSYLELEPLIPSKIMWTYIRVGPVMLNIEKIKARGTVSYVKRHVYAMERYLDHNIDRVYIGIQTTPTSFIREYIKVTMEHYLHPHKTISIYMEPTGQSTIYNLMITSRDLTQELAEAVIELCKYNANGVEIISIPVKGTGLPTITPSEKLINSLNPSPQQPIQQIEVPPSQNIQTELSLGQVLWQWSIIKDFIASKRVTTLNPAQKEAFLKDFYGELNRRSYETGMNLLQSEDRDPLLRLASKHFMNIKIMTNLFLMDDLPVRNVDANPKQRMVKDISYWNYDGRDFIIDEVDIWNYLKIHSGQNESIIAKYYFMYDTINSYENSIFTLPARTTRNFQAKHKFTLELFQNHFVDAPALTELPFRGQSWKSALNGVIQNQQSFVDDRGSRNLRVKIIVPDQPSVQESLPTVLSNWIVELNRVNIQAEFLIIVDIHNPTHDYLVNSPLVVFRQALSKKYSEENVIQFASRAPEKEKFLAVLRSDESGFFSFDNDLVAVQTALRNWT